MLQQGWLQVAASKTLQNNRYQPFVIHGVDKRFVSPALLQVQQGRRQVRQKPFEQVRNSIEIIITIHISLSF